MLWRQHPRIVQMDMIGQGLSHSRHLSSTEQTWYSHQDMDYNQLHWRLDIHRIDLKHQINVIMYDPYKHKECTL